MSIKLRAFTTFVEFASSPNAIPPLATIAIVCLYFIGRILKRPEPTLLEKISFSIRQSHAIAGDGRQDHWERASIDEKDRRRSRRRSDMITPVYIATNSTFPSPSSIGYVLDRSSGGVGIACEYDYQLGDTIFILPDSPTPDTPWIPVKVKNTRKKKGYVVLGCRYIEDVPLAVQLMFG